MRPVSSTTRLAGLIGHPITASLSVVMHNAAYEQMGLDWVYLPLEVSEADRVADVLAAMRALAFVGANVTMPYKRVVAELCDELAPAAAASGAVNTIVRDGDRLVGHNTDGAGLLEDLACEADFDPSGARVLVLGSGGAAAGAIAALADAGAARITLAARDSHKASELAKRIVQVHAATHVEPASLADCGDALRTADLVVNCTPLGMKSDDPSPIAGERLESGCVVYDMVYGTRVPTALLVQAAQSGARGLSGLGMLVRQGAIAIDLWASAAQVDAPRAPRDIMREAAERELAARSSVERAGAEQARS